MLERLRQGIQWGRERVAQFLASLSSQQRTFLTRGLPVLLIALGIGFYFLNRSYYRPLFTNLASQDAAAVVKELDAQKIPYLLSKEGSVIEVPSELVYRTRLDLAGKGLPQGGGIGFELFEQSPFGMSEFSQRINYVRALQGELARTINALAAVQSCRIHLALPERATFMGSEEKPSASVVVELRPGFRLTSEQVQGIINLVSNSVAGLTPEKVTVVDSSGRLLRATDEHQEKSVTELLYQFTQEREREIEHRVESMLESVLGPGRSVARIALELESRETQRTREEFDPTGVERSKQLELEEAAGPSGGVPGVQSNVVGGDGGKTLAEPLVKKSSQVYNYEIGKTTSQIVEPSGQVRRLTAGVLIDGRDEGGTYFPRSPEEIEAVRSMVMMAVGFSTERGDKIEVINIPFKAPSVDLSKENAPFDPQQWIKTPQGMGTVGGALALLILMWVLGRFRRGRVVQAKSGTRALPRGKQGDLSGEGPAFLEGQARGQLENAGGALPQLEEEALTMTGERIKIVADPRREEMTQIARDHKDLVVQIIRSWLTEEKMRIRTEMGARQGKSLTEEK